MNTERYVDLPLLERQARAYIADRASVKPRLSELDRAIWREYEAEVDVAIWDVMYDLDLGEGRQLPMTATGVDAAMWKQLTVRRADVCLVSLKRIVVIEIKPVGASDLVGQLELDRQASGETSLDRVIVEWVGLCQQTAPHAREYMRERGLSLFDSEDIGSWHDFLFVPHGFSV